MTITESRTKPRPNGASKIRMKPGNPDNILNDLWDSNRGADAEAIIDLFDEIMRTQPKVRRLVAEYFVTNRTRFVARYAPEITPEEYIERSEKRAADKAVKHATIKAAIPKVFSFLNCVLPSGKLARNATAPELIKAGGIFTANGKKLHKEHGDAVQYGKAYDS
jgi:hypothetical protein